MSVTDKKPWEKYIPDIAESDDLKPWDKYVPSEEKKNLFENASPSGTQTSKRGFEPFQSPVDTKTPSVLTPKGKTEYQEQVKDYVPPKEVKQPKEEKPDFFESVKNSLSNIGTGVQQFIPNTQIALSGTLEGLLGKDLGSDFYRNIVGSTHNPELDRQEAYAKLAELEPQFKRTRGLIESAENFDAVGLAAATIDAMSSLVRTAITSVPTAGIGLASDMVGGSIASYNQEKAKSKGISVDELYNRGENEFAIPATIGAIGTGLEAIGLKGTIGLINKKLTGSFAKKFATTFVDVNKEGLTEFLQTGLDASNKALSQGKSVADASKVVVDEMFSKKGLESYLMGVVGSAGASGVGRVVKGMLPTNKKKATEATQRIAEMESELNNPNITPATQNFIAENIKQNVAVVADAIENDANEVDGLSDDQKFTINSINEVIDSYEQVLSDPNASEQTKRLAQERISGLDAEVDNILNGKKLSPQTQALIKVEQPQVKQPTPDTEAQIIAEGQQAEATEIEKPKSIKLNMSEEGLAKMEGVKQKDVYPTRQFFQNKPNSVGLPEPDSPQFTPFMSENKDNTKEETVDLSEITPTQELVDKSGIGGKLTVGNPKLVRFNDGIFVLDGHHRIATEVVKGNDKIKSDVTTIDMTSDEWGQNKINKFLSEQEAEVTPKGGKSLKQLEEENKSTLPKVPTVNVFANAVEQPTREDRAGIDALIDEQNPENDKTSELPIESVSVANIVPTQNNLTVPNLEGVKDAKDKPILLKKGDKYFVIDGHHRIANQILNGESMVDAIVYEEATPKDTQSGIKQSEVVENIPDKVQEEVAAKETEVAKLEKEYEKLSKALSENLKENQQGLFENKPQSMFDDKSDQSKIVKAKKAELDKAKSELKDLKEKVEREADKINQQEIEFDNEEDYTLNQVEKTNNPDELASLYYQQESAEPDYKTEGIMDYLGTRTRINLRDWKRYNDENNLTPAIRRRYIDSTNKSGDLDANAMELSEQLGIEITPDDFANVILDFGSTKEYKAQSKTKVQKAITDKYYELTGKKLTDGRAERAYLKIVNKPKTERELYELNESLQEIGVTYEDIQNYYEYAKQEPDGTQESIRATKDDATDSGQVRKEPKGVQKQDTLEKPDLKLKFASSTELVNSKDPIGNREKHNEIKDRYKKLRQLIDCL